MAADPTREQTENSENHPENDPDCSEFDGTSARPSLEVHPRRIGRVVQDRDFFSPSARQHPPVHGPGVDVAAFGRVEAQYRVPR